MTKHCLIKQNLKCIVIFDINSLWAELWRPVELADQPELKCVGRFCTDTAKRKTKNNIDTLRKDFHNKSSLKPVEYEYVKKIEG